MKRLIFIMCACILSLPAVSFAGSVTSRWDMTIGGFVKADMGYVDQSIGADYVQARRGSYNGNQNQTDQYGNFYSTAGETRLNFLIKGPDGGGAKTSAFIEGDFRTTQTAGEGNFGLRHAFLKLDWPNATLIAGQTWQRWGNMPAFSGVILGVNDIVPFVRGQRAPQLTYEQRFAGYWAASLGIYSPNNPLGTVGDTTVNNFSLSGFPFIEGELKYSTDKCGKVGPFGLLVGLGGFYGQEKRIHQYNPNAAGPTLYTDRNVNSWGIALKGFIPIIPEKNKDKTGALSLAGNLFTGQNMSWYFSGSLNAGSYQRANTGPGANTAINPVYVAPSIVGGWGQVQYYFTNKLFITGIYGYGSFNFSEAYSVANRNNIKSTQHAVINISYDLNQSVRLGAEYANIRTRYANFSAPGAGGQTLDNKGSLNSFRIGAWYFF